jgi:hypothetical protein
MRKSFFDQSVEPGGKNVREVFVHISLGLFLAFDLTNFGGRGCGS